jgi:CheY-like chemotaxis protein
MLTRLKVGSVRTCLSGQAAVEELQSSYRASAATASASSTTASMLGNTGLSSGSIGTGSSSGSGGTGESQGGRVNLVFTDVQMPVSSSTTVILILHQEVLVVVCEADCVHNGTDCSVSVIVNARLVLHKCGESQ